MTVALGPVVRGAPDDLRPIVLDAVNAPAGGLGYVMTQQLADRSVADRILVGATAANTDVRALVETEYLAERRGRTGTDPWAAGGSNEAARQAYMALLRSAVPIRSDYVASSLMHSNVAIRLGPATSDGSVTITSANLTAGSLDRHYNALVSIQDRSVAEAFRDSFLEAWDGDFRVSSHQATVALPDGGSCTAVTGGDGTTVAALVQRIAAAQRSIYLAMFTFAAGNRLYTAITDAIARGVDVRGVVDADQAWQRWDAVAPLQRLGADLRYHPGVLTGAPGRMHHKLLIIDDALVGLGTTNFSKAALMSHETFVFFASPRGDSSGGLVTYVLAELDRLFAAGTVQAPPPVPRP